MDVRTHAEKVKEWGPDYYDSANYRLRGDAARALYDQMEQEHPELSGSDLAVAVQKRFNNLLRADIERLAAKYQPPESATA